jgi:hypothetical protein
MAHFNGEEITKEIQENAERGRQWLDSKEGAIAIDGYIEKAQEATRKKQEERSRTSEISLFKIDY